MQENLDAGSAEKAESGSGKNKTVAKSVTFEDILAKDGRIVYKTKGVSMLPMLHQNRDLVIIVTPQGRLKKYDVALYRRGGRYVLHRVIGVNTGSYAIRGDNTYAVETVPDAAVIGVLKAFVRKGRQHDVTDKDYLLYVRFWCAVYPVRAFLVRGRRLAVRAARKLGLVPVLKKILRRE